MKAIVVVGGGGHAKTVIALLKRAGSYAILGYTDLRDRGRVLGAPWLGDDGALSELAARRPRPAVVLGIGSVFATDARKILFAKLEELGFDLPAIVSPAAVVNEDVLLGPGVVVGDGVIINPGTTVGKGAILNTGCSVDHDCDIGAFVHLAPGVTLSGGVRVGEGALVGTGANVIHGVAIAAGTTVGAGATVVADIVVPGVYVGLPARIKT